MSRSTVISNDGTKIAYECVGSGPAVIFVDGALCYREVGPMKALVPLLARKFSVITYDRRGRGQSGDSPVYAPEREIEDLAALIEAAGGSSMLFGLSSGAALAMRAVEAGLRIPRLALYEPPFHLVDSAADAHRRHLATLRDLVEQGKRSQAVTYFQVDVVGLPRLISWILRLTPMWKKLESAAHTLPYDLELLENGLLPSERIARLTLPTLAVAGEKTAKFLRASTEAVASGLPQSRMALLKGQSHNVSAAAIAPVLEEFFST